MYSTGRYSANSRKKNKRVNRQVLYLTQLVVDYWLDEDTAAPVYTPFFYSSKIGERSIRLWDEWSELGVPLRIDAVEYRGRLYYTNTEEYSQLYNYAEEAHRVISDCLIRAANPPAPPIIVRKNTYLIWLLLLETAMIAIWILSNVK